MSFTLDDHLYGPTSYRKARPASASSSSGFHSRRRTGTTYSSQPSSTINSLESYGGDMTRRNEKEILQTLNDRFAGYIDKVRNLELHNSNLEAEAAALRQSATGRASVGEHYERELGDLRGLVQQLTGEKAGVLLEHEHLEEDIQHLRARLEDEARNREEMDAAARAMNKYVDECGLARLELDKKLRALEEESAFLKKNHEEEVVELLEQIQGAQVNFEVRDTHKADVTSALREIRAQLDSHASKSATQTEEWFKVRVDRLSDAARTNQDAIRGSQEEIGEYRRQLQSRTIELETLRGTKESLERQRMENEDRHHGDFNSLQETIRHLDNELKSTKWEMASQLRDYQELLNVKMALDIEIAAYRKLLEGEETRFVSGGSPYSYSYPAHLKLKGDEMSDTVIVEEQTDETQVTEVTEEADEEEEEGEEEGEKDAEEEGGEEEEGEETKEEGEEAEGEEGGDDKEDEGEDEKGEEEEAGDKGEDGSKSPGKADSTPSKSPQSKTPPKTPTVKSPPSKSPQKSPPSKSPQKSPESKSPPAKSPMPKSPMPKSPADDKSKSPASKSPESKSPRSKTPEPKSPVQEKAKPLATKEDKKEKEQPAPVKEEKKQEPKEKEAESKTDAKKESKAEEAPKKDDSPKPAEEKPAPKESPAPKEEEKKPSPTKTDKAEVKPAPKAASESKKEEKKPEEKKEEKKDAPKAADSKEEGKTDKAEKSSSTDAKESKEKAKK